MIDNCEICCWECACLNKKFIIKEHVKLLMTTDIIKLSKNLYRDKKNLNYKSWLDC